MNRGVERAWGFVMKEEIANRYIGRGRRGNMMRRRLSSSPGYTRAGYR